MVQTSPQLGYETLLFESTFGQVPELAWFRAICSPQTTLTEINHFLVNNFLGFKASVHSGSSPTVIQRIWRGEVIVKHQNYVLKKILFKAFTETAVFGK